MKLRTTTPSSTSFLTKVLLVASVVVMAFAVPIHLAGNVSADKYDDQINALKQDVIKYQNEANSLRAKADTLQNTLDQLSADKGAIQAQIDANQLIYDQLVLSIAENEKKIAENKDALGSTIADLYVDDKITPLEMLASSKNIADYLDKQEYRLSARDQLTDIIAETKRLKAELEVQKTDIKKILDEQTLKRDELASKEAAQQKLLDQTQGSEQAYQQLIGANKANIEKLQQEQQEAYARARAQWSGGYITTGGSGGYPWAGVSYPCWNASCVDPWGLYYRECVSYVAWKLSAEGYGVRHFNGQGNAAEWPSTTSGYTSQTWGNPHRGDAAVIPSGVQGIGWTGHVMFVESVNSDGTITISEYNFAGPGRYSERVINQSAYSSYRFISFPRR